MTQDRLRLLVVDDEEDIRQLITLYARHDGRCEVVAEAADVGQAETAATLHRPDVIILDVHLPGRSGLDGIGVLRAAVPDVGIVVFSSDPASQDGALASGADEWCVKSDGFAAVLERSLRCRPSGSPGRVELPDLATTESVDSRSSREA